MTTKPAKVKYADKQMLERMMHNYAVMRSHWTSGLQYIELVAIRTFAEETGQETPIWLKWHMLAHERAEGFRA